MWFDLPMEQKHTHDNDNEPLTFTQLGLPTALVINRLRCAMQLRALMGGEFSEKLFSGGKVGIPGICGIVEHAEVNQFPVNSNLRAETTATAEVTPNVSAVPLVLCMGSLTKIMEAIVSPIPIDMIDLLDRPNAVHVEPREPMSEKVVLIHSDADVAVTHCISGNMPNLGAGRSANFPAENSSASVVAEKPAKNLRSQIASYEVVGHSSYLRNAQALREFSKPDGPQKEVKPDTSARDHDQKQRDEATRADIERRIRDILAMEDRLRRKTIR